MHPGAGEKIIESGEGWRVSTREMRFMEKLVHDEETKIVAMFGHFSME